MNLFDEHETPEELGEFGLIERIAGLFNQNNDPDFSGIGDDCAAIRLNSSRTLLVTTDMMLEERHFRREWISARDLGYKSLAVNLSDISAMGGTPRYAFLSIGLPPDSSPDWLDGFFHSASSLCEAHGVQLAGGDTAKSRSIIINYTVLGFIDDGKILRRSSAKPGDKIGLVGKVGESGAGYKLLRESIDTENPAHSELIKAHNRPTLFIKEAGFLAESGYVRAMIDLSDGIQSDAQHIAKQSGVALSIDVNKLPISKSLTEVCKKFFWPMEEIALTAGEDYSLLFTFDGKKKDILKQRFSESFSGTDFSVIGEVKEGDAGVRFFKNGEPFELQQHGFDQFKTD